ncbi:hypothetical protein BJP05_04705 [Corynebacterium sp. NML98-0116]|uniref:YbjN domain-containing protein n=1 Tax=Corynebacterium lipophilum TaxID=2804918 RepID=A0AAW5HRT8_9CORY|nr:MULTISPECIES: hypothetical protein [Corynebacterium]AOX05531.1 hypothetical protein BJP05_04705 [Corynebacterium sp. NML98-0116]MCO6393637.1 YbjN domain-containing protein [Corynebacterium lipophilum]MCQ4607830.1 YbjN domain-containing protein [Corynebacterium pseudogenitalium]MCQ4609122.1 YbjN domain-containing protein [Corynebacterium sp. CCUG 61414]MCQ4611217.1 YbjN domain-containing protein [Corynebacterium sp. CCUG 51687]
MTTQQIPDQPSPVSLADVAAIFENEDLEYRIEENILRSGFVNCATVCALDDSYLIFESIWRGAVPQEMASHLLLAMNEHNQTHFAPTLRFFENETGSDAPSLAVSAIRTTDVTNGLTPDQLGAFIVTSIESTLQAFDFLETSFPTLVNWKDPHVEH